MKINIEPTFFRQKYARWMNKKQVKRRMNEWKIEWKDEWLDDEWMNEYLVKAASNGPWRWETVSVSWMYFYLQNQTTAKWTQEETFGKWEKYTFLTKK